MELIEKNFKKQTGNPWTDGNGREVEKSRIKPFEVAGDVAVTKLLNKAIKIHNLEVELKAFVEEQALKCFKLYLESEKKEFEEMKTYTFDNFDKTGRVVFEVDQIVEFDGNKMQLAYDTFVEFLSEIAGNDQKGAAIFNQKLIQEVFKNRKGRFDNKKVNSLLSHRDDEFVKENTLFQNACSHVVSAKFISGTKSYPKFYFKVDGKWVLIQLQFSGI